MPTLIQLRRGDASAWTLANPILHAGELGVELDTHTLKIGDGVLPWATLPSLGLTGPQGLTGAPGPQGPAGPTGAAGTDGVIGPVGPIGLTGPAGATGPQGPIGLTGPAGADGAPGPQGPIGLTGALGPQGPIGLTGPAGNDGAPGALGPQGPIGLTGPAGSAGTAGATGATGATGPTGAAGATGATGPAGPSVWGGISGTLSTQSDLQTALNGKLATGGNAATATLAASATVLATPRAINGVTFDGSAPITIPAAAGTLTGTTLAAGVTGAPQTWTGLQTFSGGIAGSGTLTVDLPNIGTVLTPGLLAKNSTPSTAGVPIQVAPTIGWTSHVWNTTTPADNLSEWYIAPQLGSGATPSSTLRFLHQFNGGTTTVPFTINALGALNISGGILSGGNTTLAAAALMFWNTSTILNAPANGQFNITNFAQSAGIGFNVATDAILKVRTRAQTGYATVDALGYSVSGVAGASKAAGPVTSITVVNGIVTAIS